jgi:hypothetical protein
MLREGHAFIYTVKLAQSGIARDQIYFPQNDKLYALHKNAKEN